jgi:hypothetical protein
MWTSRLGPTGVSGAIQNHIPRTGWTHRQLSGVSEASVVSLIRHLDERLSAMKIVNIITRRIRVIEFRIM